MRVLFVLFVFAGVAPAWPQQQQAAPPTAVFQAPRQSIQVQVPAPDIQVFQGQPTVRFFQSAPTLQAAPCPASFAAPPVRWVPAGSFSAPAVFAAPSPRIDVQTGLFGRVRRVIVN